MSTAMLDVPKPEYWEAAVAHLMQRDRILNKASPSTPRSG